jgi:hypothetical protein
MESPVVRGATPVLDGDVGNLSNRRKIMAEVKAKATRATAAGVVAKLNIMDKLLKTEKTWVQGSYKREITDSTGHLAKDRKGRVIMAYCMVGAAVKAGNGQQLYYELCYTLAKGPGIKSSNPESVIIGWNDDVSRSFKDIRQVILKTRARIKRYGLNRWPRWGKRVS